LHVYGLACEWDAGLISCEEDYLTTSSPSLKRVFKLVSLEHPHNVVISATEKNNKADESHLLTM